MKFALNRVSGEDLEDSRGFADLRAIVLRLPGLRTLGGWAAFSSSRSVIERVPFAASGAAEPAFRHTAGPGGVRCVFPVPTLPATCIAVAAGRYGSFRTTRPFPVSVDVPLRTWPSSSHGITYGLR